MKIKPGFEIQTVCGQHLILAVGEENVDFSKMIYINETSLFIWNKLNEGIDTVDALVDAVTGEYDVDSDTARKDIEEFLGQMKEHGIVE